MPIYEYRCSACGHELESLQKLADAPLVTCPQCSKETLTKLVSAAGFQLKGSGWYQTDFKGSGAKPATAAKTGASNNPPMDSATKAEGAKPADTTAVPAPAAPAAGSGTPAASS
jgi:putative FmdB family regulatory protein